MSESPRTSGGTDLFRATWVLVNPEKRVALPQYWRENGEVRQRLFGSLTRDEVAGFSEVRVFGSLAWLAREMAAPVVARVRFEAGDHLELWWDRGFGADGFGRLKVADDEALVIGIRTDFAEHWTRVVAQGSESFFVTAELHRESLKPVGITIP